jgi:hypothetical protein
LEAPPLETETAPVDGTETGEAEETPSSPLAGLADDDVAALPEVEKVLKNRLARQEESLRQKAENARRQELDQQQIQQYERQRTQAFNANSQWASGLLRQAMDKANESGQTVDPNYVGQIAANLQLRAAITAIESVTVIGEETLQKNHPDFAIPQELNRAFASAQSRQDIPGMTRAYLDILRAAERTSLEKSIRAEVLKEIDEEQAKGQRVDEEKKAATAAKSGLRPVGSAQVAPRARSLDDILRDPMASAEDKRKAFKAKNGFDLS